MVLVTSAVLVRLVVRVTVTEGVTVLGVSIPVLPIACAVLPLGLITVLVIPCITLALLAVPIVTLASVALLLLILILLTSVRLTCLLSVHIDVIRVEFLVAVVGLISISVLTIRLRLA